MANEDKIDIQLNLITSGATKALEGLKSSFNNTFKNVGSNIGNINVPIAGMVKSLSLATAAAAAAGTAIAAVMTKKGIDAAIQQEEAVNAVAIAMGRAGEYSKAALLDMENFASQLQKQTSYGDEEILNQVSLAQAFGATSEQAKDITRASIELAAATGKSLNEATRQVSKTLGGFAGELGEVNPRIKALTEEQLKNGAAARILLEQYGGTAIGKLNTFNGALTQNKNVFGDLLEQIGFMVTKNPVVVEGIKSLTTVFIDLAEHLNRNRDSIISFVNDGLAKLLDYAPQVGSFFKFLVDALAIVAKSFSLAASGASVIIQALLQFGPIKTLLDGIASTISLVVGGLVDLLSLLVKLPGVSDTLEAMGFNVEELSASLGNAAKAAYEFSNVSISDSMTDAAKAAEEFAYSVVVGADEVKNSLNKAIDSGIVKAEKLAKTVREISGKGQIELKVVNDETSSKKSIENYQQLLETAFGGANGAKIGGALVSGIATGLKNGKEGARAMLSSLAGAAADAFLPGLGAAVGPLVDALSMGPDAVKQMVKDFMGALPELIENIILSIPVIIEEFANQIPIIIERLVERAPDIISALIKQLPKMGIAMALQAPKIMLALAKEAPKLIGAMIKAIGDAIKKFLGLGTDGKGLSGEGGGGGIGGALSTGPTKNGYVNAGLNIVTMGGSGVVTKTLEAFGIKFAKGGEVPPGFPNDTAPAKLSSGELVIDRSTNKDLKEFLKGGGSGVSDALLLRVIKLLEAPQTFKTAVQLNNREFANIILQTNRTNQRTV